jgi:two-component system, OmpR family, sensor kinase
VIGYVQLLRERDDRIDPQRRRRLYDDVLAEAQRTTSLVDDLAAAAAAGAGAGLARDPVDLAELARRCARTAEGLAMRQGGERRGTVDAPRPVVVDADARALERVLVNLVDNAVTHSPPGSPVRVSARHEGGRAVLAVRDHGPGVAAADRQAVFEAFVSRGRGSGLGLFVVQALVDAHDGEVELTSDDDGTLVEVRLPGR